MHKIDVQKITDDAAFNSLHWRVSFWCFLILICDGYDLAVAGTALPSIMKSMNVNATTAGFMASSALFGMMFGAVILGTLADALGRRRAIAIATILFSVFTAGAGLTSDPISFSVMRFFAGVGIGGAIPNVVAHMTEYAPKKMRSGLVAIVGCGYAFGGMAAALVGKQFIETHGWESAFIAAGIPILLVPFILFRLPDSLSFLIKRNKDSQLRSILTEMRPDVLIDAKATFLLPPKDKAELSLGRLFEDGRGLSSVMLWGAFFASLFLMYAMSSWLVNLMALAGYNLGSALTFLLIYNAGAIAGNVVGGWFADKFGIKWVTFAFFVMAAMSTTLLGYGVEPMLLVAVAGASILGVQSLLYAYAAQFYPMSIRSTGVGFAAGVGRIGAIAAPIIIGTLVSMKLPLNQNFLMIGVVAALGAAAVSLVRQVRFSAPSPDDTASPDVVRDSTTFRSDVRRRA
ncbi:MFS transporter [Cupriavidus numazuensis]|uniref:4-hydroxybenzoate transporter PcaK n=1 Tax=Cupriavidus numazuensis TaxID=221992 RepID=A0ABM8TW21_9BURK|nr:MFS transporter [Cupriavidus numazuensis]CAG2160951.1 4-hydroxybenzoate transporter PcaK [Cupriavidus numazuensis]